MLLSKKDEGLYLRLSTYRNLATKKGRLAVERRNFVKYLEAKDEYRKINGLLQDFFGEVDEFIRAEVEAKDPQVAEDMRMPKWPEIITGDPEVDEVFATDYICAFQSACEDEDAVVFSDGSRIESIVDVPF